MKNTTILAVTFFAATSAIAATPENGWWWNPAESGTGWNLEFQNGTMYASRFVYDEAGNPA